MVYILLEKTRLLWLSRHYPTETQQKELHRIFGNYKIFHYRNPVYSGSEVINLINSYAIDEVFVVLPQHLVEELVKLGIKPIKAKMQRHIDSDGTAHFIHDYFFRIHQMKIVKETL